MKLNLGVIELPYTNDDGESVTTGQVATWLEGKYGIMAAFAEAHEQFIDDTLAQGFADALEAHMMGAPMPSDPIAPGAGKIEHRFKQFLDDEEMASLSIGTGYPVPTMAALMGVSHRKGAKKGARRPSFIDTGLYQSAFKVWGDP